MATTMTQPRKGSLVSLMRPYGWWVLLLIVFTVAGSALNLVVPQIIAQAVDAYTAGTLVLNTSLLLFGLVIFGIFVFNNIQSVVQTYVSEVVARDVRNKIMKAISILDYATVETISPAKLLTNLTSDVDAVKTFIAQAVASIISSLFLIVGATILLLSINWQLTLAVLTVLPFIGVTFYFVFSRVRTLFKKSQEAIDWLNKVINESVLGAALIRLLDSRDQETEKFLAANANSRDLSLQILKMFASMIPAITFLTNLSTLIILMLGGHYVITGAMTLGQFLAFNSYLGILIFPIMILGFTSNAIAQASASYGRILDVIELGAPTDTGTITTTLSGQIEVRDLGVVYGEQTVLQPLSFTIKSGSKTAIVGPTAAGKTQLLYLLTGLVLPTSGEILYDGQPLGHYQKQAFYKQIGLVFQESSMFNLSLRENIGFSTTVDDTDIQKAITTAELGDFIAQLPQGLNTIVSERGTSLSGGQKQRVMLARALSQNPQILILDDFTARVDAETERKILKNVRENYPNMTLISVTQKIAPIADYDQIIVLMQGEKIGSGTHAELLESSPEYVQIFNSQKSTAQFDTPTS